MKVTVIGGGAGGLYFALLAKKAWPRWDITVYERNRPDDTFGFGVVFSDQTLDTFKAYDPVTYERIRRRFAYWGDVDVVYKGQTLRSGGNGFCGCSRVALLNILQDRGRELGVQMRFQREVEGLEEFADADLIVVADGLNSRIRDKYKEHFQPSVDLRPNKFTWLGSTRSLDAFKYFFRETKEGVLLAHVYQYEPNRSTWVIEMDEETWRNFGFDKLSETEMLPVLERVFAEELDGHPLIVNRSLWRNFPNITNRTWVKGNAVLVGDAKATAHFSIGSGTKLAMEDAVALFEPFRLRDMVVENRVVVSPMDQYSAVDGVPGDWHFVHLGSRAVGGAGLVYVEMTCPSPEARISPGDTGLWNETQRDAFKRIVDFCHANSKAKICMQLGHSGRKGSTQLGWERMDHPLDAGNWPVVSASPMAYYEGISQVPVELDKKGMEKIIADFVRSTRFADEAGFDMLEIHMAHGYLLASFISPLTNQRKDEYGGSIENRMRFPLEVWRACRAVWPERKPMSVRISATDWAPGGLAGEDLIALTRMLKAVGCDMIDCSSGQTVPQQKPVYGRMYQAPFSDWVRNEVGIATMTVGAVTTPDQVNTLLASGKADLVALARPHLTNPYFTLQASAWYQHLSQFWPPQYLAGRDQAFRLAARERAEQTDLRLRARPDSHEVKKAA